MLEQLTDQSPSVSTYGVGEQEQLPGIIKVDELLAEPERKPIFDLLRGGGWRFGWKSIPEQDQFSFWHKHFAGHRLPDHLDKDGKGKPYNCSDELRETAPLLYNLWLALRNTTLKGHTLIRCYANAHSYGSDGTLHADSVSDHSYTSIYYPHDTWSPNWGGETVFFNHKKTDIIASVYPKPNRFLMFQGTIPHVARGVSRTCPALRITLMFKTELKDD
jgi:SM-20-related protein